MKTSLSSTVLLLLMAMVSGDSFQGQPAPSFSQANSQGAPAAGPGSPVSFSPSQPQPQPQPQPQQPPSGAVDKDFGYSTSSAQNAAGQNGYYYYYYPVKDGYPATSTGQSWSSSAFGNGFSDLGSTWSRWGLTEVALVTGIVGVIIVAAVVLYPSLVQVNARALKEVATPERLARLATLVSDAIDKYSKKNN